jgi:uncharacterized protein (TIGR04255 family)
VFERSDRPRVIQARLDRFVFSWLGRYDRWEVLREEAKEAWTTYVDALEPTAVTRAAVRFVNQIEVPKPSIEVKDYLRTSVDISPYLPQGMNGFFMQVEVPLPRHESNVRVTSTVAQPSAPGTTSLVLDIDAFRVCDVALADEEAGDTIWRYLDVLRDAKNFVFESCITDATRGLID